MSLWQDFKNWATGYDVENQAKADAADAELRAMNERRRELGFYTDEQWQQVTQDYATDAYTPQDKAEADIDTAFDEGWADGRKNVSNFIGGATTKLLGDPLRAILGGIPWFIWLGLALFIGWRLGLFDGLLRKATK